MDNSEGRSIKVSNSIVSSWQLNNSINVAIIGLYVTTEMKICISCEEWFRHKTKF
jgi:hypothetical protein